MVEVVHKFSENALQMMAGRYLLDGESPVAMFSRVAKGLAETERKYLRTNSSEEEKNKRIIEFEDIFLDVMISGKFVPAGRTLTNIGIESPVVPNCIVLPIEDSMDSIFDTLRKAALLQQAGSGIGFNFSKLRPADYETKRSRGRASGPVSFLQTYNDCFARIQQQGRHGANMAMVNINHPDILDFIRCKQVEGNIANFNISVLITDEFMETLNNAPNEQWMCKWNSETVLPRHIKRDKVGVIQDIQEVEISVQGLFNEIVQAAWKNGEPGVAFIDEINRTNPLPGLGDIDCSNPCGEQYLHAYDNCNLGSINLSKFVIETVGTVGSSINYDELSRITAIAVRMLDNVIDTFNIPVKEVQDMALANRRIGLGIMGFADMLYQLEIPYDSESALRIAEHIMETINQTAKETSYNLGKEKGIFSNIHEAKKEGPDIRRNAALTTIAPTGSISMLYDTSSGIEPNFALRYTKKVRTGNYVYINEHFVKALQALDMHKENINGILEYVKMYGSLGKFLEEEGGEKWGLSDKFLQTFVTANDISVDAHINMQAKFQEQVDNSISKTINMSEEATEEDVREAFIRGWQMKCKSFTVYRNNSRKQQVLNIENANKLGESVVVDDDEVMDIVDMDGIRTHIDSLNEVIKNARGYDPKEQKIKRPQVVDGTTTKVMTGHGNMYVTVNYWENKPNEVFATVGKAGGCVAAYMSGMTRLITLGLRSGVPLNEIVEQLKDITCHPTYDNGVQIASPADGIAWALAHQIPEEEQDDYTRRVLAREKRKDGIYTYNVSKEQISGVRLAADEELQEIISEVCSFCNSTDMVFQEGCKLCLTCGESRC